MNYNLLDEEWIPVFYRDGIVKRVGIRKVLEDVHMIRQIAASNPMDRVAILRFLLALLYWCKGNPPGEGNAVSGDSFLADWFAKLGDNKDCFNLLGGGKRFYQYNSKSGEEKLSANYLVQEVPTGEKLWHFRHSTDKINGLCPACCAMGLLRLPVFATSGGRGKSPGVNQKPPIYVIPVGISLAETLRLSWQTSKSDLGTPAWEKPDLKLPDKGNVPLLTGLTWLPRRVWLDNPEEPKANCISCGRKERLIRLSVFAGIGSTKTDGDAQVRAWSDPHVICDSGGDVMKPSNALGASDAAAGQWTKIMIGILEGQKNNDPRRVWVVGFATVQNDKYLEAMEYVSPSTPHSQRKKITMWQEDKLKDRLREIIRGTRKPRKDDACVATSAVASIRPYVEDKVSARASELVAGGEDAWEQAASEYSPMMAAIAKSLSPGFTTAAVQRRKQIASVKPNMLPESKTARKSGRKKGGNE